MFPVARLLKVLLMARFRPALDPFEASVVTFRVWPNDLDWNLHLNNGRYLVLMDLARWDLIIRSGLLREMRQERHHGLVAGISIRYRKSVEPFHQIDLRTRLLGWDDRAFFLEQSFERHGETLARGVVRIVFLGAGGRVSPQGIANRVSSGAKSPPLPEWVAAWARSQEMLSEAMSPVGLGGNTPKLRTGKP